MGPRGTMAPGVPGSHRFPFPLGPPGPILQCVFTVFKLLKMSPVLDRPREGQRAAKRPQIALPDLSWPFLDFLFRFLYFCRLQDKDSLIA